MAWEDPQDDQGEAQSLVAALAPGRLAKPKAPGGSHFQSLQNPALQAAKQRAINRKMPMDATLGEQLEAEYQQFLLLS